MVQQQQVLGPVDGRRVGREAMVITTALNKAQLVFVLAFLLLVAPGVGIFIGLKTRRLDIGIAVTGGIFTLVPAVVALVAWFQQ